MHSFVWASELIFLSSKEDVDEMTFIARDRCTLVMRAMRMRSKAALKTRNIREDCVMGVEHLEEEGYNNSVLVNYSWDSQAFFKG